MPFFSISFFGFFFSGVVLGILLGVLLGYTFFGLFLAFLSPHFNVGR